MSQRDDGEVLKAAHMTLLEEYGFEGRAILSTTERLVARRVSRAMTLHGADLRKRDAMQWFLGVVLLLASDAWAARQFNPNEVIVLPDSKFVRAVYAQPVTSDLFTLLVARETFRLADAKKAQEALEEW